MVVRSHRVSACVNPSLCSLGLFVPLFSISICMVSLHIELNLKHISNYYVFLYSIQNFHSLLFTDALHFNIMIMKEEITRCRKVKMLCFVRELRVKKCLTIFCKEKTKRWWDLEWGDHCVFNKPYECRRLTSSLLVSCFGARFFLINHQSVDLIADSW